MVLRSVFSSSLFFFDRHDRDTSSTYFIDEINSARFELYIYARHTQTHKSLFIHYGRINRTKYAAADVKSIRLISCAATVSEWLTAWLMHVNHLCVISVRVMLCSCLCSIRRFTSLIVDQFAKLSINHTSSRLRDAIAYIGVSHCNCLFRSDQE